MNTIRVVAMGLVVVSGVDLSAQGPPSERVTMSERNGAYELTVPVSRLSLSIPKGQLLPSKAGSGSSSPRYFMLEDRGRALVVSGWFENAQAFKSMDDFWPGEQRSLTGRGFQPQNVARERVGNWQVVFYDIRLPGGRSSNVRAELVQAGTWIDLHLSVTGDQSEADGRSTLRDVLNAIQASERIEVKPSP